MNRGQADPFSEESINESTLIIIRHATKQQDMKAQKSNFKGEKYGNDVWVYYMYMNYSTFLEGYFVFMCQEP